VEVVTEKRDGIVAAYQSGHRILDIEDEFGVGRSMLYSVLKEAGVLPARSNRGEKPKGNHLGSLYEILSVQERYVKQLEGLLDANGIVIPDELEEGW
jgi:hypothetical protein